MKKTGLILTGGGARGAYQSGVLSEVGRLCYEWGHPFPFPVMAGMSAGSLNVSCLASSLNEEDYRQAFKDVENLWLNLSSEDVYISNNWYIFKNFLRWGVSFIAGGFGNKNMSLLNTRPLRKFLKKNTSFKQIRRNIESGRIHGLGFTCMSYDTGESVTFFEGCEACHEWNRHGRKGLRKKLNLKHIMASSAIPVIFPSQDVGGHFYGDGSLRNLTPFSPIIHLGAEKIFAVSVKARRSVEHRQISVPTPGKIASVLMDSIFLDSLKFDLERLQRINQLVVPGNDKFRKIEHLIIAPSEDIGEIAKEEAHHLKFFIRMLAKGLGSKDDISDLVSYILFETSYAQRLIELGKKDVKDNEKVIKQFFLEK